MDRESEGAVTFASNRRSGLPSPVPCDQNPGAMPTETNSLQNLIETIQIWLATEGLAFGIRLLGALVIFVIGKWVAKFVSGLVGGALGRARVEATLNRFLTRIAYTLLLLVVIMAALDMVGVKTTSLVAIIGAVALSRRHLVMGRGRDESTGDVHDS